MLWKNQCMVKGDMDVMKTELLTNVNCAQRGHGCVEDRTAHKRELCSKGTWMC